MTDPVTVARELLEIDTSTIGGNIIVDGVDVLETTRNAQKVARAALRVDALADRLEHQAAYEDSQGRNWDAVCIRFESARIRAALNGGTDHGLYAHRIRTALNGDTHE